MTLAVGDRVVVVAEGRDSCGEHGTVIRVYKRWPGKYLVKFDHRGGWWPRLRDEELRKLTETCGCDLSYRQCTYPDCPKGVPPRPREEEPHVQG